jgi:phage terminase large subunit-like protein
MHHCGDFEALETEQVTWRREDGRSPNRLDGFVWAATEVLVGVEEDYDMPDHTEGGGSITGDLLEREW